MHMFLKVYITAGRYRFLPADQIEYFSKSCNTALVYLGETAKEAPETHGVVGWGFEHPEEKFGVYADPNLQLQLVEYPEIGQKYCFATIWHQGSMKNISFLEGYIVNERGETIEKIR